MAAANENARRSASLKAWVDDLRLRGENIPIRRVAQRVIHPGLEPLSGNGFVAAQPVRRIDLPGSWPYSVAVLHWLERNVEGKRDELGVEERDSAIGAL